MFGGMEVNVPGMKKKKPMGDCGKGVGLPKPPLRNIWVTSAKVRRIFHNKNAL